MNEYMEQLRAFEEAYEVTLPTIKEVCLRCNGEGTHDAWEGGMTRDEMDEQGPEFFEDYMSGMYSVTCTECHGNNVVDVVDERRADPAVLAEWMKWIDSFYEYEAERAAELAAG